MADTEFSLFVLSFFLPLHPYKPLRFFVLLTQTKPNQTNPIQSNPVFLTISMALKAIHASEVPNLDNISDIPSVISASDEKSLSTTSKQKEFLVIGHRGNGMNSAGSSSFSSSVRENSILSFNVAGRFPVDFVEFDVQVTGDGHPIIFHDNFIITRQEDSISEMRVTDLSLEEFFSYGKQKDEKLYGKPLLRKTHSGIVYDWTVETDAPFCMLEEAFREVDCHLGFNIELKFDDDFVYRDQELVNTLGVILATVREHAGDRPVIFSTFQPDAARLVRRLQTAYPVLFLTDGGTEIYGDARRNSLEEAVKLCTECGLQGIVSEVRGVLRNPSMISRAKELGLCLLTYGGMNNVGEVVHLQRLMGIDGVIVDRVREITEAAVSDFVDRRSSEEGEDERPMFSAREISFLLKLVPELVGH